MKPSNRPSGIHAITTLVVPLLAIILRVLSMRPPAPLPANAPLSRFSAARAMQHYKWFAHRPRPVGSAEHDRVKQWILEELRHLHLQPSVQTATVTGQRFRIARARVQNIFAVIPGRRPRPAILLMAHYDSVPLAPGAGDDGSGIITLLETARALLSGPSLQHPVFLLMTDAEEMGLLGAEAFVQFHPRAEDVGIVINLESRGHRGPAIMFQTSHGNRELIRLLARNVPHLFGNSLSEWIYRQMPNSTDLEVFLDAGFPAVNVAFIHGIRHYHSVFDRPEGIDPRTIQHMGDYALAMIRSFDEHMLDANDRIDSTFFTFYGYFFHYSLEIANIFGFILILIFLSWFYKNIYLSDLRTRDFGVGLFFFFAFLVLAYLIGLGWRALLPVLHSAAGSGFLEDHGGKIILSSVLLVLWPLFWFASQWIKQRNIPLHTTTVMLWTLTAIILSFAFPHGHFLFFWPVLIFFLVDLPFQWRSSAAPVSDVSNHWPSTLTTVVSIGLWTPVLLLSVEALSIRILPIVTTLACLLALLHFPTILVLSSRLKVVHAAIPTGFMITGALLIGLPPVRHSNLQTATLNYIQTEPEHRAWWISREKNPPSRITALWTQSAKPLDLHSLFPFGSGTVTASPAPPKIQNLLHIEQHPIPPMGKIPRARWHITPTSDTAVVNVIIERSSDLINAEIDDGDIIPIPLTRIRSVALIRPPSQGFDVTLVGPSPQNLRFWLIETRTRFPLPWGKDPLLNPNGLFIYRPYFRWPTLIFYRIGPP